MTIPKDNSQLENARRLRREMTPHERKLWYLFLRKYPVKIYKQRIIGRFIADFYCASAKLVIELDGSQHYEPQGMAYDSERSAFLTFSAGCCLSPVSITVFLTPSALSCEITSFASGLTVSLTLSEPIS